MARKKVREGMRVEGNDEDGLKDLPPAQSLRGLVVFMFHMVLCPDACNPFKPWHRASLFSGSISSSLLGENLGKRPMRWGAQIGFLFVFRLALGTGMGFCAAGDAGCNFHAQLHAGAPSRESRKQYATKDLSCLIWPRGL